MVRITVQLWLFVRFGDVVPSVTVEPEGTAEKSTLWYFAAVSLSSKMIVLLTPTITVALTGEKFRLRP